MQKTKSPIKNLPVHVPGQSLDRQIRRFWDDEAMEPLTVASLLCTLAFMEWIKFYTHARPMPKFYTLMALGGIWWAYRKIRKARLAVKNMELGLTGERAVGQYLEETLAQHKYHVFHDIPGEGFNLDHVIVGPTGVFCIETKTRSKPAEGNPTVQYDGETIKVNGMLPERDPVIQAKAEARWLHDTLEASTGKKFNVQPIVLFPGWFVEPGPAHSEVWVLNDKAAPAFIQNAKGNIPPDDIALIVFHLKRYIISADSSKT
jgi:hypothetical protein